jgi:hypothetical protein
MLNNGHLSGRRRWRRAKEKLNDAEVLFGRPKRQVKADYNSKGQVDWRREAREDFDCERATC